MRTDKSTDLHPYFTAALAAALALAAPQSCVAQGPVARSDSANQAPAAEPADTWYPEGPVRIRRKRYALFVGATYTWFSSQTSRSRFGGGTWSPSFELYRPQRRGYSPLFELNGTRIASDDSTARVFAASVGVRYRPVDAERSRWLAFSIGVAGGPRLARISGRERTTVFGVSAQVGLELLRTARLTARHEALPTVHGAQLSTLSLGAVVRLPPYGGGGSRGESHHTSHAATCAGTGCAR